MDFGFLALYSYFAFIVFNLCFECLNVCVIIFMLMYFCDFVLNV